MQVEGVLGKTPPRESNAGSAQQGHRTKGKRDERGFPLMCLYNDYSSPVNSPSREIDQLQINEHTDRQADRRIDPFLHTHAHLY